MAARGDATDLHRTVLPRRGYEVRDVADDLVVDLHLRDRVLHLEETFGRRDALQLCGLEVRGVESIAHVPEELLLDLLRRVVDQDLEEEAVELRLGQRIGACALQRVLRGEHEVGLRQRVRHAVDRDGPLRHRLEHRALRLRRGAVDLVREQDVREHRAVPELELALLRVVERRARHVGRHEVRRELHAAKVTAQDVPERSHEQRLSDAGDTFEQHVSARQHRDQHRAEDLVLSDEHTSDLVLDGFVQPTDFS